MKRLMFSVYDSKAEAYLPPFVANTEAVAIRMVAASTLDPNSDMHRFGADYTLFHIGEWDEDAGLVALNDAHINLGTALSIMGAAARNQGEIL